MSGFFQSRAGRRKDRLFDRRLGGFKKLQGVIENSDGSGPARGCLSIIDPEISLAGSESIFGDFIFNHFEKVELLLSHIKQKHTHDDLLAPFRSCLKI